MKVKHTTCPIAAISQCPDRPAAADLADSLESLRLFQPCKGTGSHHRPLPLPEPVSFLFLSTHVRGGGGGGGVRGRGKRIDIITCKTICIIA